MKKQSVKDVKILKRSRTLKGYGSTYNVEILNLDQQLIDTESEIRNKLNDLLAKLKGLKFAAKLVLEFKKLENDGKNNIAPLINESNIDDVFESIYSAIL